MGYFLCYYRAVDGPEMPFVHVGDTDALHARFKDSVTPVVRIIPLTTPELHLAVTEVLEAHLTMVPKCETGLVFSLKSAIESLKAIRPVRL